MHPWPIYLWDQTSRHVLAPLSLPSQSLLLCYFLPHNITPDIYLFFHFLLSLPCYVLSVMCLFSPLQLRLEPRYHLHHLFLCMCCVCVSSSKASSIGHCLFCDWAEFVCVRALTQQGVGCHCDRATDKVVYDTLPCSDLPSKVTVCIMDFRHGTRGICDVMCSLCKNNAGGRSKLQPKYPEIIWKKFFLAGCLAASTA